MLLEKMWHELYKNWILCGSKCHCGKNGVIDRLLLNHNLMYLTKAL